MNIITELLIIVLGIAIGFVVIMFQIIILARIYQSWAWTIGALAFVLLGSKQVFGLVRLPSAILQAQLQGVMIDHLNGEQWITVAWTYLTIAVFIWFLDWLRRDLKKIGV